VIGYTESAFTASGDVGWTDLGYSTLAGQNEQLTSYQIVASTGMYAYTGTTDNGNARTVIATFEAAAAAAGTCRGALSLLGVGGC